VLFLTGFGLVMVLSASSVEEGATGNPYSAFLTQGAAALVGVGAMLAVGTRVRADVLQRVAPLVFFPAVIVQLFTAFFGVAAGGNRNWLVLGGVSVQPSEFVKLGLVLILAAFFANRPGERLTLKRLAPVVVFSGLAFVSVYAGHDLGTCLIIGLIIVGGLWFGGVRVPVLIVPGGIVVAALAWLARGDGSRTSRVSAYFDGCTDLLGTCWQTQQAQWALANGGLLGVGIGNSVSKWFWLPEADNDFIAAIIGEETGLVGLLVLIGCFVAVAVVLLRIATGTPDRFTRAAAGMAIAWLVGQAFANLAVVIGVVPVFGVPLPFVSSGGSSLVATLLLVGCVLAAANRPRPPAPAPSDHPAGRAHPIGGKR
jgi:cell division protein FtsW